VNSELDYNKVPDDIKNWKRSNILKENPNPFCYNMYFIQCINLWHTDFIWTI